MRTIFLAQNLFNEIANPGYVVTASSEAAGHEAFRVGAGRRHALSSWTPATANVEAWVAVDAGAAVTASMCVIDRGHNLAGHTVIIEASDDNFSTATTIASLAPAATSTPNSSISTTPAHATTDEGAVVIRFAEHSARYWRLRIPAMGAGLAPIVVGLYLGAAWQPAQPLALPYQDEDAELQYDAATSGALWMSGTAPATRRLGEIVLKVSGTAGEAAALALVRDNFIRRRPTWIIFDDLKAERAVLAIAPSQRAGMGMESGWFGRTIRFNWVEHEPELH